MKRQPTGSWAAALWRPLRRGGGSETRFHKGRGRRGFSYRLEREIVSLAQGDLLSFHEAGDRVLERPRFRTDIPRSRFVLFLREGGSTASAGILVARRKASARGWLRLGSEERVTGLYIDES